MKKTVIILISICLTINTAGFGQNQNSVETLQKLTIVKKSSTDSITHNENAADTNKIKVKETKHSKIVVILDGDTITQEEFKLMFNNGFFSDNNVDIIVLKEPSTTSMYPINSSNGIIVITTKPKYDILVFDEGYNSFLATQPSKEFYSLSELKAKNNIWAAEWNRRCLNPMQYNPQIYEATINYDNNIEYGLDVEYKLYMFFRYMKLN
jgi:hypothetical protein